MQEANQTPRQNKQINEQKLSRRQFFFIIIQTQIGVGVLSIPYDLHSVAKQDGWISLIIGGLIIPVILFAIWLVAKNFPEESLFSMNEKMFTKWGGRALSLGFIIYFTGVGALIILLFGKMISVWVLPNTPMWVLTFLMITVCIYMVNGGLLVLGRLYTMLSFLLIFLLISIAFSTKEMRIIYLFPILESGWGKIFAGVNEAIFSFFGFIVSLVIYSKVEGTDKEKLKTIFYSHLFVLIFYLFTVLATFTFFSTSEIPLVPEPVLYMLKSFSLPIVARIDLFFISIWVVNVATSFATYLYLSSFGLSELFKIHSQVKSVILIGVIIFIMVFFIGVDISKIESFSNWVIYSGYIFSVGLPILMVPFSYFRKNKMGASQK